jgi:hypothetical protein
LTANEKKSGEKRQRALEGSPTPPYRLTSLSRALDFRSVGKVGAASSFATNKDGETAYRSGGTRISMMSRRRPEKRRANEARGELTNVDGARERDDDGEHATLGALAAIVLGEVDLPLALVGGKILGCSATEKVSSARPTR